MKVSFGGASGAISVQVSSLPEITVLPEPRLELGLSATAPISTVAGVVCGQCAHYPVQASTWPLSATAIHRDAPANESRWRAPRGTISLRRYRVGGPVTGGGGGGERIE